MNNAVGLSVFALGIVLLILGFEGSQSLGREAARAFSSSFVENPFWMVIGGALAVSAGLYLAFRGSRS